MTSMVDLENVSARGPKRRGQARALLSSVTLKVSRGLHAVLGTERDGAALLFDIIDGTQGPLSRATVLGVTPALAHTKVARVSLSSPLPHGLRVAEVCAFSSQLRGEPVTPSKERLSVLGIEALSARRVESLSVEERRAIALALALTSRTAEVVLVEEPFVSFDARSSRLVPEALRSRAMTACVIVTTSSPRDALHLADRLFVLDSGGLREIKSFEHVTTDIGGRDEATSLRLVVTPTDEGAVASLLLAIDARRGSGAISRVESRESADGSVVLTVFGREPDALARLVTEAVAASAVEVEDVQPSALPLTALHIALAARAASPPPGSLPPGPLPTEDVQSPQGEEA